MLRVDMDRLQVRREPVPPEYERLGGRALIAGIMLAEVPPQCDPLGPDNKLIFAPGLLGGTGVSSSGRLSVGGKSPLTWGVKEANCGGNGGSDLARLGVKALVVEGQPAPEKLYLLHISGTTAELLPADDWRGLGTYATAAKARERWGSGCTVISIGQAGEYRMGAAGVSCTGHKEQDSRLAARGGLGALMGSKGLKAIVLDASGTQSLPLADPELFRSSARRFAQELVESPKTGRKGAMHLYGTAAIVAAVNEMGAFPTRNFREGRFEEADNPTGQKIRETGSARGGPMGARACSCRNCPSRSNASEIAGPMLAGSRPHSPLTCAANTGATSVSVNSRESNSDMDDLPIAWCAFSAGRNDVSARIRRSLHPHSVAGKRFCRVSLPDLITRRRCPGGELDDAAGVTVGE